MLYNERRDKRRYIMFVSSYNTYISTDTSNKSQRERVDTSKERKSSFDTKLLNNDSKNIVATNNKLPLSYISNYKALSNQQKLQEDLNQNFAKTKFTKINKINNALSAYMENSTMFPLLQKPKLTLNQTLKTDKKLPQDTQKAKESIIRRDMINTYIANDNYYKITA
jgi:hypothetical protein